MIEIRTVNQMARTRKPPSARDKKSGSEGITERDLTSTPISNSLNMLSLNTQTNVTEKDILAAQNSNDLMKIIESLTNTNQDELFNRYKEKTEVQLQQNSLLINELQEELQNKQEIIDSLLQQKPGDVALETPMKAKNKPQNMYVSPIRKKKTSNLEPGVIHHDQLSKELETIGITLDMLELLTGVRIINYEEDESKFHFDVKQTSTNGDNTELSIEYRLIIAKEFTSTAEINYVPTFLKDINDSYSDDIDVDDDSSDPKSNPKLLMQLLPDYFCDSLTFPYNTLSQFYTKMNRALNKGAKS